MSETRASRKKPLAPAKPHQAPPGPLIKPEFPRSAKYDPDWMMDNQMGPNALWLMEWLCEALSLAPGMRVLDLGCGKAMTSIFLAREFGVQVYAADLWMSPDHNWRRAVEASVADLVCPIKAEAHALPFAQGFFDAVVSVDAYQYFGTDELYIDYLSRFVRPNGSLGVVVVGLMQEMGSQPPPTSPSRSRTARCSGKAPAAASKRQSSGAPSGRAARWRRRRRRHAAGRLASLAGFRTGPLGRGQEYLPLGRRGAGQGPGEISGLRPPDRASERTPPQKTSTIPPWEPRWAWTSEGSAPPKQGDTP